MVPLEIVLKISLQGVLKMSWRRLDDVLKTPWRRIEDVLKTFWRCLDDVLKTYGQDEYIVLDQDVFWRGKAKANIFVLIKTSWRRLEDVFWRWRRKTSSKRLQDVFIKANVCWDITLLALSVCVLFYIGAGKDGITIVPEETKFPEVKRQNLLWLLQMLLFAWTVRWASR